MDKGSFIKLLRKYVRGKATSEEQQFIVSYYNLFESDLDVLALMSLEQKDQLKQEIFDAILQRIAASETDDIKIRLLYPRMSFAAAACILFMVFIGGVFFARLHLSSEQIDTTYVNRTFENQTIHLQDGSTILLSPKGKISYPLSFANLSERAVQLEGEAFFDIKPDSSKPFTVTTGKLKTHVLGTSFNIQALREQRDITVTVLRGKVKVDGDKNKTVGLLTKSQQITYDTHTDRSVKKTVDTLQYVNWKSPYILFKNASLREARLVLEKQYDVKIILEDEGLRSKRFTTTFKKSESLDQVLKSLCEFHSAIYKYDQSKGAIRITQKSIK
jgi:transmembrane sensor